jgi:hypothetical protein
LPKEPFLVLCVLFFLFYTYSRSGSKFEGSDYGSLAGSKLFDAFEDSPDSSS